MVVVGGGIAGLSAAHRLREVAPELEIVLLEQSDRLGGKIHTEPFAGQPVEAGAETFLLREAGAESRALDLARRVGLGDDLIHPAPVNAALAIDGELRPLPGGTLMGIPAEPGALHGVASVALTDTDNGRPLLDSEQDVTVGALVRQRLGDEVVERLVDPLLGGVYAGRADDLSLRATIPGLHHAARTEHTLLQAVRAAMRAAPRPSGAPVFASLPGGLSRLVGAVAERAAATVQCGETVRSLERTATGWRVHGIEAGAVVLAVPAAPAARLLSAVQDELNLPYASVALVTLALPPHTVLPELSGFLVPADQGFAVKAATFFTTKWPHLHGEAVILRASLGRHTQTEVLRHTDDALVALVRAELPRLLGAPLPEPRAARVTRWGGGLPQYGVGHVERVAALRKRLPPSLALAGAAYDGVGIAACVRSGEAAAEQVLAAVRG